jgi:hypothetical protein
VKPEPNILYRADAAWKSPLSASETRFIFLNILAIKAFVILKTRQNNYTF